VIAASRVRSNTRPGSTVPSPITVTDVRGLTPAVTAQW